jgi:hypothetical protein
MAPRKKAAPAPDQGPKKIANFTTELGATGLKHYGGILDEEFNPNLRGEKGRKVFREMAENDPVVGAVLFAIEMLIRQVSWDVTPASKDEADQANADFLTECMNDQDRPWSEVISEILTMLVYGWQATHPVYKMRRGPRGKVPSDYSDGKIGWAKLPTRSQDSLERWDFSDSGDVLGMVQMAPPKYQVVTIPMDRLILFRTNSRKGSPEGRSILRSSYQPWFFKKKIEVYEAIGIERDLAGMPLIEAPAEWMGAGATATQKGIIDGLKRLGRNIRMDEQMFVLMPQLLDADGNKQFSFQLVGSPGSKQIDTTNVVNRYNTMIAVTVLADFVLLGQQAVGSYALSDSKTKVFAMALSAWVESIAATFNRVEIPRLFALNGYSGPLPKIEPGDIEERDLGKLGEVLGKLAGAGFDWSTDEGVDRYLRRTVGVPDAEEEGGEVSRAPAADDIKGMFADLKAEFSAMINELKA